MYYDGDMMSSSEWILFECPSSPKVIKITEDISIDALRKTIMDAIGSCKILLDLFYRQPIYVDDGCIEYECKELKCNNDMRKMIFICLEFSSKCLIELNVTFG